MTDDPKKPTYVPKLGFLKHRPTPRLRKKSAFLRKLERAQLEAEFDAALDAALTAHRPAPPPNVVLLDQSRRKTRR